MDLLHQLEPLLHIITAYYCLTLAIQKSSYTEMRRMFENYSVDKLLY